MIYIITRKKIKGIFEKFPNWAQADINCLIRELIERRNILQDSLAKVNASQVRDKDQLGRQIEKINEALKKLYSGKASSPLLYEMLKTLFCSYLKEDRRKENVGRGGMYQSSRTE